jgi:hypothetical protein
MAEGTLTIKAKVTALAKNGKGFKLEGNEEWFTAQYGAIAELKPVVKGDIVEVTYKKNGVFLNVSKIVKVEIKTEEPKSEIKETQKTQIYDDKTKKTEWTPKSTYGSPEDIAGKQRGNALNAAAMIVSNPNIKLVDMTPEALAEVTKIIAEILLTWARAE